jgi:hypothetical protein
MLYLSREKWNRLIKWKRVLARESGARKGATQICVFQGSLTFIQRKFNSDLILRCKLREGHKSVARGAAVDTHSSNIVTLMRGEHPDPFIAKPEDRVYQTWQCLMWNGLEFYRLICTEDWDNACAPSIAKSEMNYIAAARIGVHISH